MSEFHLFYAIIAACTHLLQFALCIPVEILRFLEEGIPVSWLDVFPAPLHMRNSLVL